jgi:hypothetical protein
MLYEHPRFDGLFQFPTIVSQCMRPNTIITLLQLRSTWNASDQILQYTGFHLHPADLSHW